MRKDKQTNRYPTLSGTLLHQDFELIIAGIIN